MENKYLVTDGHGNAVAKGTARHGSGEKVLRLQLEEGDIQKVMEHTCVTLVSDSEAVPALEGLIVGREGEAILLEPVCTLEPTLRKNLRIPIRFSSYLYLDDGRRGRAPITSYDLSCGGLAFFCSQELELDEVVQVVIPVTSQPLLLHLKILRRHPTPEGATLYGGKFLDLLREEESMVREAVFSIQLKKN